ncbi:MAG: hypothetical protein R3A10_11300 [Caldilineaceae bacterium]
MPGGIDVFSYMHNPYEAARPAGWKAQSARAAAVTPWTPAPTFTAGWRTAKVAFYS